MKTGRNDPCPCGSGKKYKQCCFAREAAGVPESDAIAAQRKAREWLTARFGEPRRREAGRDYLGVVLARAYGAPPEDDRLAAFVANLDEGERYTLKAGLNDWTLRETHYELHGDSARGIDWALRAGDLRLTAPQRAYLEALAAAPLRLYEVVEVERERGLHLRDLLQPNEPVLFVREVAATRSAEPGLVLGARLLALHGHRQLGGAVYALSQLGALEVLNELDILRSRRQEVGMPDDTFDPHPPLSSSIRDTWLLDRLQPPHWRAQPLPALELVDDHYDACDRAALDAAMAECAAMEPMSDGWLHVPDEDSEVPRYMIHAVLDDGGEPLPDTVAVSTRRMADAARAHFETLAGAAVRYRERKSTHIAARDAVRAPQPGADEADAGRNAEERTAQAQQRYHATYADWADTPLPILGHRAPRALLADAAGCVRVRLLLQLYDDTEADLAHAGQRAAASFDFLRAELGLG